MTRPNLNKLKKNDILWLYNHKCKAHNRRYIEHPACYAAEKPADTPIRQMKIGFLDIEATELVDAHFGWTLCYCIKELDGPTISNWVTQKEIRAYDFDKRLIADVVKDIEKFDHIITWNGGRGRWGYDIPWLITRALKLGVAWPEYKNISQTDLLVLARQILKLRYRSLERVCRMLGIPAKGHRLDPDTWQKCQAGCDTAMLEIVVPHCQEDVVSLEGVFKRIIGLTSGPGKGSV